MRKLFHAFTLAALFVSTTAFLPPAISSLEGKWFGEYKTNDSFGRFQVHFWIEEDGMKGTINIPKEGIFDLELSWIIMDSRSVHFEVEGNSRTIVFDGQLINKRLEGSLLIESDRGTFDLYLSSDVIR